jgi:magnesium chelatase subunit D
VTEGDDVEAFEGGDEHQPCLGPEAEMVTDGAEMKRVDHPGSPGAESVVIRGPAGRPTNEAADGEPGGLLEVGLWGGGDTVTPNAASETACFELDSPLLRQVASHGADRRRRTTRRRAMASHGRSMGAVPMVGSPRDVAWEATLRAVAHEQAGRARPNGLAFVIQVDELQRRRRVRPPEHLLLLVVDASGSMAGKLTATARKLAERALARAYIERQRVAMIAFRAHGAELLFGPTTRVERARSALDKLSLGGATPLGRGLELAHDTVRRAAVQAAHTHTTVLVISDGDANVGNRHGYGSAFLDVEQASRKLVAVPHTDVVLLDTTEAGKDDRSALWLAEQLGARHIKLAKIS